MGWEGRQANFMFAFYLVRAVPTTGWAQRCSGEFWDSLA